MTNIKILFGRKIKEYRKKYRDKEVAEAWGGLGEREMKRGGVGKERGKEWNG